MPCNPAEGFLRVIPELRYRDPDAAVEWLSRVFGFTETLRWIRPDGILGHADLELDGGVVMVAYGGQDHRTPADLGQFSVQIIFFLRSVDEHFRRSQSLGARILVAPTGKPWGLRQYLALDLEGHAWEFSAHIRDVPPEAWGATT
jgi:uncharacterized glyoxalase superfamily protein PhnB